MPRVKCAAGGLNFVDFEARLTETASLRTRERRACACAAHERCYQRPGGQGAQRKDLKVAACCSCCPSALLGGSM
eukprot:4499164-Pleurochrysis_carterae.AAC.1